MEQKARVEKYEMNQMTHACICLEGNKSEGITEKRGTKEIRSGNAGVSDSDRKRC